MRRILLVDTHISNNELSKVIVALGYDVRVSQKGVEALKTVKNSHPHVIILNTTILDEADLQMCAQIRQLCQTPILVLSADGDTGKAINALTSGADVVLPKPVSNRILVAHLETLSRRAQAELDAAAQDTSFQPLVY